MAHPEPHQWLNWGSIQHYKFLSSHLVPLPPFAGGSRRWWFSLQSKHWKWTGWKSPAPGSQGFPRMLSSPDGSQSPEEDMSQHAEQPY